MRLAVTLVGVVVLCLLGLHSALERWPTLEDVFARAGVTVGALFFVSCFTGMMIARIHEGYERAERLVRDRTRALADKVTELEEARASAVAANAAKSTFLATMSHELRTPLNAILGFSELIKREMYGPAGDARYVDYAGHIHDSGSHLLSLVRDILDLSKIEAGKMEIECELLAVGDIVHEARKLAGRGRQDAHHVSVLIEDDLPLLYADKRAMLQILLNLLSNAMKFTPPSGAIAVTGVARADGGITLNVRDSGIGMAKADIAKALAPYVQVQNAQTRAHEGTGLGLPIVSALVRLHGGEIELESEPGQGTRVSLHFPPVRSARAERVKVA